MTSLTTGVKRNLRAYKTLYAYNIQDYADEMFFFIFKMVLPDTHECCSKIKTKLETIMISQFKRDIPKASLNIA